MLPMSGNDFMYKLEDFGSFYIGGRVIKVQGEPLKKVQRNKDFTITIDPNGDYDIDAIYVQYFLPVGYKEVVILIHGGGHTGSVWETTPDGREGWLHLLLKKGVGVYIVDTIERGRAGWCVIPGVWAGEPEQRSNQLTWSVFRFGAAQDFAAKIPYPNQQFPVTSFDQLVKYNVPRWNCNAKNSARALSMLINKIGTCSLVAHSQGVDIAMQCFELIPALIKNVVLIEPAAFPDLAANVLYKNTKIFTLFGDYVELNPLWLQLQQKTLHYIEYLQSHGITAQHINLPEVGIYGNSHMSMMDMNNDEVLEIFLKLIELTTPAF